MARSIKKGPFVDHHLMQKVDKARTASDKRPIKTSVSPFDGDARISPA
jgi:small subunit ribosomal protein S19